MGVGLVWALVLCMVAAQDAQSDDDNCQSLKTCRQCIQTPNCMWCSKPKVSNIINSALTMMLVWWGISHPIVMIILTH